MDTELRSNYCKNCPDRDVCEVLCQPAEKYTNQDHVPARELAWSELTDSRIEDVQIKSPWGGIDVLDNSNWIALIKKLRAKKIKLTTRQKTYLYLHQIQGKSQACIANKYGVSQQAISKILKVVKIKLMKIRG